MGIDLSRIQIGDEIIVRLPNGQKILGEVDGDDSCLFVKTPDAADIYFAYRDNVFGWVGTQVAVIGHIPSMFGGDW